MPAGSSVQDAESGDWMEVNTGSKRLRTLFSERSKERLERAAPASFAAWALEVIGVDHGCAVFLPAAAAGTWDRA